MWLVLKTFYLQNRYIEISLALYRHIPQFQQMISVLSQSWQGTKIFLCCCWASYSLCVSPDMLFALLHLVPRPKKVTWEDIFQALSRLICPLTLELGLTNAVQDIREREEVVYLFLLHRVWFGSISIPLPVAPAVVRWLPSQGYSSYIAPSLAPLGYSSLHPKDAASASFVGSLSSAISLYIKPFSVPPFK